MKNQTIRLRKNILKKVFPTIYTKMRMEDFTSKAVKNKEILNKREFDALINVCGGTRSRHFEFFAKRKKDRIELIPFD